MGLHYECGILPRPDPRVIETAAQINRTHPIRLHPRPKLEARQLRSVDRDGSEAGGGGFAGVRAIQSCNDSKGFRHLPDSSFSA